MLFKSHSVREYGLGDRLDDYSLSSGDLAEPNFAACAACFSLRVMFRVCHDLLSVLGFGFCCGEEGPHRNVGNGQKVEHDGDL